MSTGEHWVLTGGTNIMGEALVSAEPFEGPRLSVDERIEVVPAAAYHEALDALRAADSLLRQFSISAHDHSELIRREFGKAQQQINAAIGDRYVQVDADRKR